MACADPVGMISKFSPKVLMMHMTFLLIRVISGNLFDVHTRFFNLRSCASLIAACFLLRSVFGVRFSRATIWEHRDVLLLTGMAVLTAIATEWIDAYMKGFFNYSWLPKWYRERLAIFVLSASSDYIEILSFVPAMWMVCRENKNISMRDADVVIVDAQTRALALFVFILTFYTAEDLQSAWALGMESKFAAAGHVAHFLMLLDFSTYILSHLYDPAKNEKLMNKIWNLLADNYAV